MKHLVRSLLPPLLADRLRRPELIVSFALAQPLPKREYAHPSFASVAVADNFTLINDVVVPLLGTEATVLDVGCGGGGFGKLLREFNPPTARWLYAGCEVNDTLCAEARGNNPNGDIRSTNGGTELPFSHPYDLVIASGVLQYVADWSGLLTECVRLTKQVLLLTRVPVVQREPSFQARQTITRKGTTEHAAVTIWQRSSLEHALTQTGLAIALRDNGTEVAFIPGVAEPIIYTSYVLRLAP